ncbi:MAG TPA: rhodanese-like domain-containing protein [Opitutaceae bacterium]
MLLCVLALAPAVLTAWLHPRRPDWVQLRHPVAELPLAEVRQRFPDALWVDARKAADYARDHVSGAVLLNEDAWDEQLGGFVEAWRPGQGVVVYCDSAGCGASRLVAERLRRELGVDDVVVLQGGWAGWRPAR